MVKGADFFVESAGRVARKLGVSQLTVGLTLVAVGTSIPELSASIAAALRKQSGIVVGNVIGSNAANIGLVIALASVLAGVRLTKRSVKRDSYIMLIISLLFFAFAFNQKISALESVVLLSVFIAYVLFLFSSKEKESDFKDFIDYFLKFEYVKTLKEKAGKGIAKAKFGQKIWDKRLIFDVFTIAASAAVVIISSNVVVGELTWLAAWLSRSTEFVGITVLAIGTSLPELSVSLRAAKKGFAKLAIGNVIGSNIANLSLVAGLSGLISPLEISQSALTRSLPAMILLSSIFVLLAKKNKKLSFLSGSLLGVIYLSFLALSF